ncbi:uncharacterized protein [Montipora foliosa]|uniref:uncharacterized protein isoform X2 n=1 Tax=Montipora foliosa TaxID=591990 RepID=UPI0035F10C3C
MADMISSFFNLHHTLLINPCMLELVDDVSAVTGVVIEDVVTVRDDFRKDSCVIRVDDTAEVAGDVLEEVTRTGDQDLWQDLKYKGSSPCTNYIQAQFEDHSLHLLTGRRTP